MFPRNKKSQFDMFDVRHQSRIFIFLYSSIIDSQNSTPSATLKSTSSDLPNFADMMSFQVLLRNLEALQKEVPFNKKAWNTELKNWQETMAKLQGQIEKYQDTNPELTSTLKAHASQGDETSERVQKTYTAYQFYKQFYDKFAQADNKETMMKILWTDLIAMAAKANLSAEDKKTLFSNIKSDTLPEQQFNQLIDNLLKFAAKFIVISDVGQKQDSTAQMSQALFQSGTKPDTKPRASSMPSLPPTPTPAPSEPEVVKRRHSDSDKYDRRKRRGNIPPGELKELSELVKKLREGENPDDSPIDTEKEERHFKPK